MVDTVSVRSATHADAPAVQAIHNPVVVDSTISFEEAPPDVEEIVRRMLSQPRFPWLVAIRGEAVIGYGGASAMSRC